MPQFYPILRQIQKTCCSKLLPTFTKHFLFPELFSIFHCNNQRKTKSHGGIKEKRKSDLRAENSFLLFPRIWIHRCAAAAFRELLVPHRSALFPQPSFLVPHRSMSNKSCGEKKILSLSPPIGSSKRVTQAQNYPRKCR